MMKYEKPVLEEKKIEIEDIIASSSGYGRDFGDQVFDWGREKNYPYRDR